MQVEREKKEMSSCVMSTKLFQTKAPLRHKMIHSNILQHLELGNYY